MLHNFYAPKAFNKYKNKTLNFKKLGGWEWGVTFQFLFKNQAISHFLVIA